MLPDAPERLLAAGEREQAHRHAMEDRLVAIDERSMPHFYAGQTRAHVVAVILGLAYLTVMALAIVEGAQVVGIAGAAGGLAALVWAARRDPTGSSGPELDAQDPQDGQNGEASDSPAPTNAPR